MPRKVKNQPNILPINKDERSSRFVVDLISVKSEKTKEKQEKSRETNNKFFIDRVAELEINFREKMSSVKSSVLWFSKNFSSKFRALKQFSVQEKVGQHEEEIGFRKNQNEKEWIPACACLAARRAGMTRMNKGMTRMNKWYGDYRERLEELAFFGLFKFVVKLVIRAFRLFYKICYGAGWLFIFLIRLLMIILNKLVLVNVMRTMRNSLRVMRVWWVKTNTLIKMMGDYIIGAGKSLKQKFRMIIARFYSPRCPSCYETGSFGEAGRSALLRSRMTGKRDGAEDYEELPVEKESYSRRVVFKPVLGFALILFILILPFKAFTYYKSLDVGGLKGRVLGVTDTAVSDLMSAAQQMSQLNFNQAGQDFREAGDNFLKAEKELGNINEIIFSLASFVPSGEIRLAAESKKILAAGQIASSLGSNLNLALESLFGNQDHDLLEIIDSFVIYGEKAVKDTQSLNLQLNLIDERVLPSDYEKQFIFLKEKVGDLEKKLTEFVELINDLKIFLGENQDKRYLLVFQNNTELRATGGFIGSFALVDFREGKIKSIEVPGGGSYDTEGGMRELVAAPEPLSLVNPLWHFWDANWWPDWRLSAEKLMWFYERSDGPTVDGVISFTPTVLEKLLKIIGPVDMTEEYGVILTAENFWLETQAIAEEKLTPEQIQAGESHKPKRIIGDLMNKIIEELPNHLNKESLIQLLSVVEDSLSEKHILFYFVDERLQAEVEKLGWDGSISQTNWDYLAVINTNIAGGKSDKRMDEEINQVVEIMPNGSIVNTVKIVRTHTGVKREPFCGVRNVNWMRIYVPAGSELLEAQGFRQPDEIYFEKAEIEWQKDPLVFQAETTARLHEPSGTKIYNESGKTVFANWSMVDPGESVTIYLKYKLPFNLEKEQEENSLVDKIKDLINPAQIELYPYAMLLQKQAGAMASNINSSLILPGNFKIAWKYPKDLSTTQDGWQISDELDADRYWAVLLEIND